MPRKRNLILPYVLAAVVLIIGLAGINRLFYKANLPFEYKSTYFSNGVIVEADHNSIRKGEKILYVNSEPVNNEFRLEFLIDRLKIGDTAELIISNAGNAERKENVSLVPYYRDLLFIAVSLIIGLSFWLTAVFVITIKSEDRSARTLFYILLTFGLATLTSPGYFGGVNDWMGLAVNISHSAGYTLGCIFFLRFAFVFPTPERLKKILSVVIYAFAILMTLAVVFSQTLSLINIHSSWFSMFNISWSVVYILLVISLVSGVIVMYVSYRNLTVKSEKRKIEWIFWGIAAGISPYVLLYVIPKLFSLKPPLSEEYLLAFLIIVPFSFAAGVAKYHVLDIEIVVKRSIVYSVLLVIVAMLYGLIIYFLSYFTGEIIGPHERFLNLVSVFIIALVFNPLRLRLKRFVDVIFYREKFVFDKAVTEISQKIRECITTRSLGKVLAEEICKLIPVSAIMVVVTTENAERVRIIAQKNFTAMAGNISALRIKKLDTGFDVPFAQVKKVERDVQFSDAMENVLKRWDINIVIPLTVEGGEVIGAIILGDKLSGLRYSHSDVDLLNTIAFSAALAMKKLELQNKLIEEEVENIRLTELSQQKSYFAASVSHDLKTPLTAIRMFAELLQNEKISKEKATDYLKILIGETGRLNRLIDNVLDFAKIERGTKEYRFGIVNLNEIVKDTLLLFDYELKIQKFRSDVIYYPGELNIWADADAVKSVLMNLLSNAIKYSNECKEIKITTGLIDKTAVVTLEDKGIGIPEKQLEEIFDPFFRGEHKNVKGAGLGLSIVKHVVDSHHGEIKTASKQGEGSFFTLFFPLKTI